MLKAALTIGDIRGLSTVVSAAEVHRWPAFGHPAARATVLDRQPPLGASVRIGNERCDTIIGADNVVTCRVPPGIYSKPRTLPIVLELRTAARIFRTNGTDFVIRE